MKLYVALPPQQLVHEADAKWHNSGITAASFGVVGAVFALQFFSDVPKVRTDICQVLSPFPLPPPLAKERKKEWVDGARIDQDHISGGCKGRFNWSEWRANYVHRAIIEITTRRRLFR